jgi:hypothetical protein
LISLTKAGLGAGWNIFDLRHCAIRYGIIQYHSVLCRHTVQVQLL